MGGAGAAGDGFLDWWRSAGLGQAWGIVAAARADMPAFRRHLKKLLRAQLPDGRVVYFRFYDPRVLRTFLPLADARQLGRVFGPIERFFIESESGHPMRSYRLEAGRLAVTSPQAGDAAEEHRRLTGA
ncbi:DUF4123 domain-containing protein [Roseomonas sp. CCTCC AB2023176]|uniref:DUF4123 domain-containing protein n=1 Tax=Roseomonas sp. CCTCC AB2023176 TaxID=3342640 RepID=UPI0035D7DB24